MLHAFLSGFADSSVLQLALIAGMALLASVVGGVAGYGTGPLVGGTVGAGISLLLLLMAAGLEGAAVVATDAVISIGIGVAKFATFGLAGAVDAKVIAVAVLIGGVAFPGAFFAKALVDRLPVHLHTAMLDAVVIGGGVVMLVNAFIRSAYTPSDR